MHLRGLDIRPEVLQLPARTQRKDSMILEAEQLLAIIGLAFCAGVIFTVIYDSYAR